MGRRPHRHAAAADVGPACHRRRPTSPHQPLEQRAVPVCGVEVDQPPDVVDRGPSRHYQAGVGEGDVEGGVVHGQPRHAGAQQHRRGDHEGVVEVGDQLAGIGLRSLGASDRHDPEQFGLHASEPVRVGIDGEHGHDAREVDAHAVHPSHGGGRVVLPGAGRHPRAVGAQAEAADEAPLKGPVPWPPDHPHEAEVPLGRLGEPVEVLLDNRRAVTRAQGDAGSGDGSFESAAPRHR